MILYFFVLVKCSETKILYFFVWFLLVCTIHICYTQFIKKKTGDMSMAIGERIHHFRLLRGFTQKYLGQQLGFSESQADVRIAQYEKALAVQRKTI